jgi:hypothetical protein
VGEEETDVTVERRVIMLSRGGLLGTFAVQALGDGRALACLESPADLDDWAHPPVDVVLLDFPRRHRGIIYRQLRQRYRGPVLALLDPGDDGGGLPSDRGPLAILHRPFSGEELSEVLGELLTPAGADRPAAAAAPSGQGTNGQGLDRQGPDGHRPLGRPNGSVVQLVVSGATLDAAEQPPRRSRWNALARRGLRRWEVGLGLAAIMLLGLAFGAPSGCRSGCTAVAAAGGAEGGAPSTIAAIAGPGTVGVQPGPGGSSASSTGSAAVPLVPPATSVIGSLISSLGSGSGSPLLVTTVSAGSIAGLVPPTSSPVSNPPTTRAATTTTTRPATTRAPTTTKPPAPTTTAPPPTTAPPAPTTTAPPPTTAPPAPTTTAPPPPPPTTAAGSGLV